ncbi:hypothetical protein R1flu_002881 [Riccia fluitans]|uniref:EGF-like domain-containing protein n=1 Tax=Riccia fluitans TaxID=41844 RepID=A0ABD1Y7H0_9MARC
MGGRKHPSSQELLLKARTFRASLKLVSGGKKRKTRDNYNMTSSKERAASAMHLLMSLLLLVAVLECSHCLSVEPLVWSLQRYPEETLGPTNWRYYRVDLPVGFSLLSISFTRNWEDERTSSETGVPLACFGFNGPPLVVPPVAERSLLEVAIAAGEVRNASATGECGWFNETIVVNVTNFEILSGLMYIGIYSDIGPTRTQSHMVDRGKEYKFSLDIQVLRCSREEFGGSECNERISPFPDKLFLSADFSEESGLVRAPSPISDLGSSSYSQQNNSETIWYSGEECFKLGEIRYFSFRLDTLVPYMIVDFQCNKTNSPGSEGCKELEKNQGLVTLLQLRHDALPSELRSDYTTKLSSGGPVFAFSPRRGWWYLSVRISNTNSTQVPSANASDGLCLTMNWVLPTCGGELFGDVCQRPVLPLKRVLLPEFESPFDSHYFPTMDSGDLKSARWFSMLLPFNSSSIEVWNYFTLEVPRGAGGGVLSLDVWTAARINSELYARFESCPANNSWDYRASESDTLEGLSGNISTENINEESELYLDIVYPKEGMWCIGLRSIRAASIPFRDPYAEMRIILHGCPNMCSGHGECRPSRDAGRLHFISYCHCDVAHGAFDCSAVLVAPGKKMKATLALTFSNAAAILPSVWAIRHKAYAEWITFMLSGFSSAVYHSCDSGGWCAMSFATLQFLDFWLSFLAIIMTCLYMAGFVGPKQGMMHIGMAVLTATISQRNATSGWNVLVVVVLGIGALLLGWGLENRKGSVFSPISWLPSSSSLYSIIRTIVFRWASSLHSQFRYKFRWLHLSCGLFFLFNAILSLILEAAQTYWLWHSWWHVSIYTCAFCMLQSILPAEHRPNVTNDDSLEHRYQSVLQSTELDSVPETDL